MTAEPQTLGLDIDGTQFRSDDRLEIRAGVLLGRFPELYSIREAVTQGELRFGFLLNVKPFDVLTERRVCGSIGKSAKASPVWRDLTGLDAVLWVRGQIWDLFDANSRDALLLHLLLHFEASFKAGSWRLATRDHDYAGFNDVARHFGGALPDTASLIKALSRGDAPQENLGHRVVEAMMDAAEAGADAVRPLSDMAERTGTTVTIEAQGRSVTFGGREVDPETGEVLRVDDVEWVGTPEGQAALEAHNAKASRSRRDAVAAP